VQGNLTWQAKTGYVALSAAAFRPTAETQAYLNPGWWVGTTSILGFSASVQLPHGASVEKLTYHYSDSSSTHNGSLSLYRNPMNGSVSDQMASVATSGSGGDGSAFSTSIDYATVDNSQYSYYLFMVGIDPNRKIKCYGVVIEYTFTEPY
jgi:hypothetical protein